MWALLVKIFFQAIKVKPEQDGIFFFTQHALPWPWASLNFPHDHENIHRSTFTIFFLQLLMKKNCLSLTLKLPWAFLIWADFGAPSGQNSSFYNFAISQSLLWTIKNLNLFVKSLIWPLPLTAIIKKKNPYRSFKTPVSPEHWQRRFQGPLGNQNTPGFAHLQTPELN